MQLPGKKKKAENMAWRYFGMDMKDITAFLT